MKFLFGLLIISTLLAQGPSHVFWKVQDLHGGRGEIYKYKDGDMVCLLILKDAKSAAQYRTEDFQTAIVSCVGAK